MYRRMTLIGVLTAIASLLVFGIANALPASNGLSTQVTFAPNPTTTDNTNNTDSSITETTDGTMPASSDTSLLDEAVLGDTTYLVGNAGSVVVNYDGTTLTLVSADAVVPWTAFSEHTSGTEIEVDFTGDRLIKFKAELEDGGIRIVVEELDLDFTTDSTVATDIDDTGTDSIITTSTTIDDDDDEMDDDDDDYLDDESDDDDDHDSNQGSDDHEDHDDDDDNGDDRGGEDHGDDD